MPEKLKANNLFEKLKLRRDIKNLETRLSYLITTHEAVSIELNSVATALEKKRIDLNLLTEDAPEIKPLKFEIIEPETEQIYAKQK